MIMTALALAVTLTAEPPRRDRVAEACRTLKNGRTAGYCPKVELGPIPDLQLLNPGEQAEVVLHQPNGRVTTVVVRVERRADLEWWPPEGATTIGPRRPAPQHSPDMSAPRGAQQAALLDGDMMVLLVAPVMVLMGCARVLREPVAA